MQASAPTQHPKIAALVVAAGTGQRAGGGLPKQFRLLGGEMVLLRTVRALLAEPRITSLQVVTASDWLDRANTALAAILDPRVRPCCPGGATRQASVLAGLNALQDNPPDQVLIHDAARPYVTAQLISDVIDGLAESPGTIPALPVVDALWQSDTGALTGPIARDGVFRAQTPQGFHFQAILAAQSHAAPDMADDAAIARAAGLRVAIVPGDAQNIKLTTEADFEAQAVTQPDIRTGNGFDVHAFTAGDHVTLCGHKIAHSRGLSGHSDADVGLHALTDAIFGALAEGDIGQWFPPSDDQWKGANSAIFLQKAVERAKARGFAITHLDCTLICEYPKIGPHIDAMRAAVAAITGLDAGRISVKATTTEQLGFAGRKEGIAAMATATLVAL